MLQARPIWIESKECEMNIHAVFCTRVETEKDATLHIGGTVFYRVYINGAFVGAGPARTAKGYIREDILAVGSGKSEIVIEAVGYHCCSLSTVCQTSLHTAEQLGKDNTGIASCAS